LLTVAITVGLFIFSQHYTEKFKEFQNYGYLGMFVVSLVSNATVILPVPGVLIFLPLISLYNPVLLGLAGAAGGIIGEITGYMAGYGGRGVATGKKMFHRAETWMKRWGGWTIFIFAAAPFLPFDVAGMVAGALRYPLWKFLLIGWAGKSLKYVALAVAAAWGWENLLHYLSNL
jgi:membrane protein YqaA with SNARE-associated domain